MEEWIFISIHFVRESLKPDITNIYSVSGTLSISPL